MTKIPVDCYECIDEAEFTELEDGRRILACDVGPLASMPGIAPVLLWNGRKRTIKKIKGQWYLIERVNV